jgi:hypothetical protein
MNNIEPDVEEFPGVCCAHGKPDIADVYQKNRWVLLPGFLPRSWIPVMARDVLVAPSRRVSVGASEERWTEHSINEGCLLGAFLGSRSIIELAQSALAKAVHAIPEIWAQSYVTGERIDWHCDAKGEIQLLLCLEAPAQSGGEFCMRIDGDEVRIALRPADALLFSANAIPHSTTRLIATAGCPSPRRITAAARMFPAEYARRHRS